MIGSLPSFGVGLAVGVLCSGLLALVYVRILFKARAAQWLERDEQLGIARALRQQIEGLQESVAQAEAEFDEERGQMQLQLRELQEAGDRAADSATTHLMQGRDQALGSCKLVGDGVQTLLGAVKTFERWHTDMNTLIKHNRHMHDMNEDFASIVRHMLVVTLNASIEAAKAGSQGRGFSEVAKELRSLATRAENLSNDYRRNLYENDLITTITFQDLQAGGKMIVGSVVGLGLHNDKTRQSLSA